ncbi:MAG: LacI family DNA-binding transcriptional regulator [Endozoicomonas sp.]
MATIKDVADRAQVSRATVSRVINNTAQVTDATRERVNTAIRALKYSPSPVAQSLASNTSNTIGLMVSSYLGGFFGDLMDEVEHVADASGKLMIVTQGKHSAESERAAIEHLIKMRCDGLILHVRYLSDAEVAEIADRAPPMVILDRHIEALADHCITFDHVEASERAVGQLIQSGHQRIACLTGKLYKTNAQLRFQGYANALRNNDIPLDWTLVVEGNYERQAGYQNTLQLINSSLPYTAIYACSEELAAGCMDAFREKGIRVPDDVSMISYDSVDLCTFLTPHVSAIHFPITDMASVAGSLLLNELGQKDIEKPFSRHFTGDLRRRESIKRLG